MNPAYLLCIPFGVGSVSFGLSIWLYFNTRVLWRKALDSSGFARLFFRVLSVLLLPLLLGGWSDIIDLSSILDGNVSTVRLTSLSLLTIFFNLYLYLHLCWWDREEHSLVIRTLDRTKTEETQCQKEYLITLMDHFRHCIGRYTAILKKAITDSDYAIPLSSRIPATLRSHNLRLMLESVRQTYKSLETVEKGYDLQILLLRRDGDYLVHDQSFDGTSWDCQRESCDAHRELYFNLRKPNSSAAVVCAALETIEIIEDCEEAHADQQNAFAFFQDCAMAQRETLGSMVTIPITANGEKYVLCITCPRPGAFLRRHQWKARTVQRNFEARLALLDVQTDVFSRIAVDFAAATARFTETEKHNKELTIDRDRLHTIAEEAQNSVLIKDQQIAEMVQSVEDLNQKLVKIDAERLADNGSMERMKAQLTNRETIIAEYTACLEATVFELNENSPLRQNAESLIKKHKQISSLTNSSTAVRAPVDCSSVRSKPSLGTSRNHKAKKKEGNP